jgi:lysophospholipase L1-like esterase
MKKYNILSILLSAALIFGCAQEVDELKDPAAEEDPTGTLGTVDASNFVTIGDALVAGYQANALFTDGQNESVGKIVHRQMVYAGATGEFNQPDINSENGFSGFIPSTMIPVGRLILYDPDGSGPRSAGPAASGTPEIDESGTGPCTKLATPAVPAPYNTSFSPMDPSWAFTGDKDELNNFGVPGILLGQILTPLTGGPSTANPAFNPYYMRFATDPGTSTILGDAIATAPTFVLIQAGNNDVLGYATTGASGAIPLTSQAGFQGQYNAMINMLLSARPDAKGVVANIPNVTTIPFFFTVKWNAIPLDAATATTVTTALATPYNGFLQAMVGAEIITAEEAAKRTLTYTASATNPILITDETLTDLSPYMTGPAAALVPYARARQTTANDLITLTAGSVLGTCFSSNPQAINGVTWPLPDQYVLIPSETAEILTRTAEFNAVIADAVAANTTKLALANVNAAFTAFVSTQGATINGIRLTPSITPPYAGFSEDGVHPNGRGYAFLANIFIDAINAKFGATIPHANITHYRGTRTPITPTNSY